MAAPYIRNVLLTLLVLVPVLAGILALPRLFANLLQADRGFSIQTRGVITAAMLAIAFGYLGLARPVRHGRESKTMKLNNNVAFAFLCILPLTVAGFGLSLYWAQAAIDRTGSLLVEGRRWAFWAALAMTVVPCV